MKSGIEDMYVTYNKAGGNAELVILPNIGHDMINNNAQKLWGKPACEFLIKQGVIPQS